MKQQPASTALGRILRDRRGSTSITTLADALGVSHATLSRTETGRTSPSADLAVMLGRWLGMDAAEVVDLARRHD
jgi:transcriptional regulator with XRE-family HTH domain